MSMSRSEDVLSAAFFLVDHSNVEILNTELSGKETQNIQKTTTPCHSARRLIQQSMLNFS